MAPHRLRRGASHLPARRSLQNATFIHYQALSPSSFRSGQTNPGCPVVIVYITKEPRLNPEAVANEIRSRLAADNPLALELIWTEYAADLLGYLVSLHGSRSEAEDTLQEVFITIAKKRTSVAASRLLKPYLFQLARNVALNRIKKDKRMQDRMDANFNWLVPVDPDSQDDEQARQLAVALAALPEKQRAVLVLKFYRDKTLREIGELLGVSENTAASCFRYGMEKLRVMMIEGVK
jgi:RNA polymerase sigma-70 factor, ECF subfamily